MSDVPQGPRWWRAPDGKWYPPEKVPLRALPSATQLVAPTSTGSAEVRSLIGVAAVEDVSAYRGLATGWYQDAADPTLARHWDGSVLSEERRLVVPADSLSDSGRSPSHTDAPCVSAWPDAVQLQTDLSPISWSPPRFLPWGIAVGTPVASIAPLGYPAYVRILHPTDDPVSSPGAPWRDVAAWSGRTYHPLMQFERLSRPRLSSTGPPPFDQPPPEGHLATGLCEVLYAQLARWTSTPETCWVGLWEGQQNLTAPLPRSSALDDARHHHPHPTDAPDAAERWAETAELARRAPRFALGGHRFLLARTPVASIATLGRPPLHLTANLAWPDDRAWYVVTDVDFDATLVATSNECANALLADNRLEALPVHPLDRIDIHGDVLNVDAETPR